MAPPNFPLSDAELQDLDLTDDDVIDIPVGEELPRDGMETRKGRNVADQAGEIFGRQGRAAQTVEEMQAEFEAQRRVLAQEAADQLKELMAPVVQLANSKDQLHARLDVTAERKKLIRAAEDEEQKKFEEWRGKPVHQLKSGIARLSAGHSSLGEAMGLLVTSATVVKRLFSWRAQRPSQVSEIMKRSDLGIMSDSAKKIVKDEYAKKENDPAFASDLLDMGLNFIEISLITEAVEPDEAKRQQILQDAINQPFAAKKPLEMLQAKEQQFIRLQEQFAPQREEARLARIAAERFDEAVKASTNTGKGKGGKQKIENQLKAAQASAVRADEQVDEAEAALQATRDDLIELRKQRKFGLEIQISMAQSEADDLKTEFETLEQEHQEAARLASSGDKAALATMREKKKDMDAKQLEWREKEQVVLVASQERKQVIREMVRIASLRDDAKLKAYLEAHLGRKKDQRRVAQKMLQISNHAWALVQTPADEFTKRKYADQKAAAAEAEKRINESSSIQLASLASEINLLDERLRHSSARIEDVRFTLEEIKSELNGRSLRQFINDTEAEFNRLEVRSKTGYPVDTEEANRVARHYTFSSKIGKLDEKYFGADALAYLKESYASDLAGAPPDLSFVAMVSHLILTNSEEQANEFRLSGSLYGPNDAEVTAQVTEERVRQWNELGDLVKAPAKDDLASLNDANENLRVAYRGEKPEDRKGINTTITRGRVEHKGRRVDQEAVDAVRPMVRNYIRDNYHLYLTEGKLAASQPDLERQLADDIMTEQRKLDPDITEREYVLMRSPAFMWAIHEESQNLWHDVQRTRNQINLLRPTR
jgi:hypothetical protein